MDINAYGQSSMVHFDPPIKEIIIFQHIKIKCSRNFLVNTFIHESIRTFEKKLNGN